MTNYLSTLHHQIIVSVQAEATEPLGEPKMILAMAQTVMLGGAKALRLANPENIKLLKEHLPDVPVIGITKPSHLPPDPENHVYITPNLWAAESVAQAGAEIIAMDATLRPRPNGEELADIVQEIKKRFPNVLLMGDIATQADAENAQALGFDMVGTTLSGYTAETQEKAQSHVPDFELLTALVEHLEIPVIMEGRVWEPAHVTKAFDLGAHSVVIGSAVTRPHHITQRFLQAIPHLKAV